MALFENGDHEKELEKKLENAKGARESALQQKNEEIDLQTMFNLVQEP